MTNAMAVPARKISVLIAEDSRTQREMLLYLLQEAGGFEIAETGLYRFFLTSDDGAWLRVDDETLVDVDGEHEPKEDDGEIALAKVTHQIEIFYFQGTEGKELRAEMEGPAQKRAPIRYR